MEVKSSNEKKGIFTCGIYAIMMLFFQMDVSKKILFAIAHEAFWNKYLEFIFYTSFAVIIAFLYRKFIWKSIIEFIKNKGRCIKFCIGWFFIILVLAILTAIMLAGISVGESSNEQAINEMMQNNKWITGVTICIIVPFVEEMIFRGILYQAIRGKKATKVRIHIGILVVSLIFALYHCDLNFILSGDYMEVLSYAPLFFVGLGLNWLYEISNNIWCPILVHMIINILA